MLSKNKSWRKRILPTLGLIILISPCAFCWWVFIGNELVFHARLPIYPGAQEVASEQTYEHYGTQAQRHYFWTRDSFDSIHAYYDHLASPFAKSISGLNDEQHPTYRTAFNPYGGAIRIVTEEFGGDVFDGAKDLACYYRVAYACVEVYVVDYGDDAIDLEAFASASLGGRQATPVPLTIQGGRLIVYTYYVAGF